MITASNLLTRIPPLFADLSKILDGEIDCNPATLTNYGNDGSPYFVLPQAVIYPKHAIDIKHILAFAREYKMPVTVRGKGTSRTGGALGEGIILDMTRYYNQIRNINMVENTITVDVGATIGSLLEKLQSWHYDIPLFSRNENETSVGALIATKSSSTSSFKHGTVREWIESLTVIVDTGEEHHIADGITPSGRLLGIYQDLFPLLTKENPILRASKPLTNDDATGYNLWNTSIGPRQLIDQLVGSEGTLGIITSVTFRISPHKTHHITTCIPVTDIKLLPVYTELAKEHKAEKLFFYDQMFMQLAEKYHPMTVPFFPDTPYVLLVTHSSLDKEKLHHEVRNFKRSLPLAEHFLKTIDDESVFNRITDNEFLLLLADTYTSSTLTPVTVGNGIIVTSPQLPTLLIELEDYLNSLGNLYILTGNIGSGNVSVTTLFDSRSRKYDDDILSYAKNLFSIVKHFNGGISAVGGEGLSRTPFLSYVYNDTTLLIFKKIKEVWDPLLILNPGKKLGTTTSYLQQHLKHSSQER